MPPTMGKRLASRHPAVRLIPSLSAAPATARVGRYRRFRGCGLGIGTAMQPSRFRSARDSRERRSRVWRRQARLAGSARRQGGDVAAGHRAIETRRGRAGADRALAARSSRGCNRSSGGRPSRGGRWRHGDAGRADRALAAIRARAADRGGGWAGARRTGRVAAARDDWLSAAMRSVSAIDGASVGQPALRRRCKPMSPASVRATARQREARAAGAAWRRPRHSTGSPGTSTATDAGIVELAARRNRRCARNFPRTAPRISAARRTVADLTASLVRCGRSAAAVGWRARAILGVRRHRRR